jgi:CRP-like cAMP-binding protein
MPYTHILKNISKHIQLDEDEQKRFSSLLVYKQLQKKDFLLKEGEPCKAIYFVNSGALRAYCLDKEGRESTIMFAVKDWWITDMHCFVNQQPAMMFINVIENSSIWQLKFNDLQYLYTQVPKFERFFRIIMQNAYTREQLRIIQKLTLSAEERYLNFLQKYPQITQQVTQKQIASYLGITPEFLSTIRKKLSTRLIS